MAVAGEGVVYFWSGTVGPFSNPDGEFPRVDGAAAFDVDAQRWRPMASTSAGPANSREGEAVWTGTEIIAWGEPRANTLEPPEGVIYDSADNSWRVLSLSSAPDSHVDFDAVWTGTEMIVWGGTRTDGCLTSAWAAYSPTTDSWRAISTAGPSLRSPGGTAWTGTELITWGGRTSGSTPPDCESLYEYYGLFGEEYIGEAASDGWAYDPATDLWRQLWADGDAPEEVATGEWTDDGILFRSGGFYDFSTETWAEREPIDAFGAGWWDGGRRYSWGPWSGRDDFEAWDPVTGEVERLAAPARHGEDAIWTGSALVAWGAHRGSVGVEPIGGGWLYSP